MFDLFILLVVVILIAVSGLCVACVVVRLWTGCSTDEAIQKIRNLVNGKVNVDFTSDEGFIEEIWINVRNVIGEARFKQLRELANSVIGTPLLSRGYWSGLPYIAIAVFCVDEDERRRLESVLTNVLKIHLRIFGLDTRVLADWKKRYDLAIDVLVLRYAKTKDEKSILDNVFAGYRNKIITLNMDVIDDTEDADLLD